MPTVTYKGMVLGMVQECLEVIKMSQTWMLFSGCMSLVEETIAPNSYTK